MSFEEFEKSSRRDLRARAKASFERAEDPDTFNTDLRLTSLLEAQFYMQELDRRQGSWIATRDLILEIVVILLIGGEIWFGNKAADDQGALMKAQTAVLQKLNDSTSATATILKGLSDMTKVMSEDTSASSKTLTSLKSTTETMNKGVHDQLSLFYDPSISVSYVMDQNRLLLTNTGRSGITLRTLKVDGKIRNLGGTKLIAGQNSIYVELENEYKKISSELAKGTGRTVPVEANLENELGKRFVLNGALYYVWENDKVTVHGQNNSIQPEP